MRHGIAAAVHAVDVAGPDGELRRLVLKLYVRDDPSEPDQAAREARILQRVAGHEVPVPQLVALDREGGSCGSPALLMTRLEGHVILRPRSVGAWLRQLAALLATIHAMPIEPTALDRYRTYPLGPDPHPPRGSVNASAWREAIARVAGPPPEERACFIHRDFHPGNVLWEGSRPSAVVDWAQGCWGPPAADIGHCRWNLWYLHGREAADAFLAECGRRAPHDPPYDRYWDLAAALGGHSLRYSDGDQHSLEVAEQIVVAAAGQT